MQKIEECYNNMAEIEGTTVDQLRMLLPHSTAAELYMTANIRECFTNKPEVFDPRTYLGQARTAVKDMVKHKIEDVLGCAGKA